MEDSSETGTSPLEWIVPLLFVICGSWVIWHLPAFTLDWSPPETESAFDRLSAQFKRNDVTPDMAGVFGGFIDMVDFGCFVAIPILAILGILVVRRAPMEQFEWNLMDRISVFLGRVTMMLVAILLSVMLYEVILRYVFEAPTLWANELSLWIAGFVFLFAGLYAMQQRSHIRIFLLYDILPRGLQRTCDVISTVLIGGFVVGLIWGGYGEASQQFYRWETLGTAFDPPIPATLTPAVLIVVTLVWFQAISNLIRDWNVEPHIHTAADDIDQRELEELKRKIGSDGDV
ncbi:MAG: TRAP transporter small permease [Pseudomonadota bacterium]